MMFRFSSTRINCNKNDCTVTVELHVENLFVVSLDTDRGEELVIMCPLVFNIVFQYNPSPVPFHCLIFAICTQTVIPVAGISFMNSGGCRF